MEPVPLAFRPVVGESAGTVFRCGLCGMRFTHGERSCSGCPIGAGCDLVRCPRCGYQFPRASRLAEWLGGWWRRGGRRR